MTCGARIVSLARCDRLRVQGVGVVESVQKGSESLKESLKRTATGLATLFASASKRGPLSVDGRFAHYVSAMSKLLAAAVATVL